MTHMKKILALLLSLALLAAMTACDTETGESNTESTTQGTVSDTTATEETTENADAVTREGDQVFSADGITMTYAGIKEYGGTDYYCLNLQNDTGKDIFLAASHLEINGVYVQGAMYTDPLFQGNENLVGIQIDPTFLGAIGIGCVRQIKADFCVYDTGSTGILTLGNLTVNTGNTGSDVFNTDDTVVAECGDVTVSCLDCVAYDENANAYIILRIENDTDYPVNVATASFQLNGAKFDAYCDVRAKADSVMYAYIYMTDFDLLFAEIDSIDSATMSFSVSYAWDVNMENNQLIEVSDPVTVTFD